MILLPYSELQDLLKAAREIRLLRQEMKRLEAQHAALKGQFLELMELFRELE